jgi:hypothetical protein
MTGLFRPSPGPGEYVILDHGAAELFIFILGQTATFETETAARQYLEAIPSSDQLRPDGTRRFEIARRLG